MSRRNLLKTKQQIQRIIDHINDPELTRVGKEQIAYVNQQIVRYDEIMSELMGALGVSVVILYNKNDTFSVATLESIIETDPCSIMSILANELDQDGAERIFTPLIMPTAVITPDRKLSMRMYMVRLEMLHLITHSPELRTQKRFMTTKSARS